MQHFSEEMTRLMRTSNAMSFIFYPHSASSGKPQCIGQRIVSSKRSKTKSRSGNAFYRGIGFTNQRNSRILRHANCRSESIPGQILSKCDVWVVITSAAQRRNWLFDLQHMMRVQIIGIWATPRQRRADCNSFSTHSTLPPNLGLSQR